MALTERRYRRNRCVHFFGSLYLPEIATAPLGPRNDKLGSQCKSPALLKRRAEVGPLRERRSVERFCHAEGLRAASRAEGRLPASELVRQRGGGLRAVRQQLAHEQRFAVPLRRGAADGIARLDAVKASGA